MNGILLLFKISIMQKCHHLSGSFAVEKHTAMADWQNNMIAHIRTMRFADQDRTIMCAVQT